ncbi:MAG: YkgJ family cysteine cluster protein [Candidatus Thermoplasmatota archaeon]|nr:YkgJ family cysteine cluster protein [Candidatus Thermoplasmatota archaeon]
MDRDMKLHSRQDSTSIIEREWAPLKEGARWSCIRCGWCCRQPWAVNMTWAEFERTRDDPRFSKLIVDRIEVDQRTGATHPYFVISGACPLFEAGEGLCSVHPDWFYTCATWPFLLMPDGTLMINVRCKGIGTGEVIRADAMRKRILRERERAGMVGSQCDP